MNGIQAILARLEGVKRTGQDRYIARCPAHDDRGLSLSIRSLEDERVLLHCFAGCTALDVVSALGMDISALFPPRTMPNGHKRDRRPFSADDALRCLSFEASLIYLAACDLAAGKPLSDDDRARLAVAAERVNTAMGATWMH